VSFLRAEEKEKSQEFDEGVPRTPDFGDPRLKLIESASPIAFLPSTRDLSIACQIPILKVIPGRRDHHVVIALFAEG
jgi:hypothetical protein